MIEFYNLHLGSYNLQYFLFNVVFISLKLHKLEVFL